MRSGIRWGIALAAVLVVEILLIGAAFVWVAIYSHLLDPGHPVSVYRAYAGRASPWVSVVVGVPLFYDVARRWTRGGPTTWAWFGLYLALDASLLLLGTPEGTLPLVLVALSYGSKAVAAALGSRRAGT